MMESQGLSDVLQEGLNTARAEEVRTRQAADMAQRALTVWTALNDYYAKQWHAHIVSVFYNETAFFQNLRVSRDPRATYLDKLLQSAEEAATASIKRLPTELDQSCQAAGLELDRSSRHPRYTVRNFIVTEVDEAKLLASITPRDGKAITIPTDVPAITQGLVSENRRLFVREFEPQKFMKSLFTAYQAAIREDNREAGDDMPLKRVVHRLGKNLSSFALDEFNIDLARVIKENKTAVEDYRLHLGHTRNTRQGMLLHELEGSGYVGFIAFRQS